MGSVGHGAERGTTKYELDVACHRSIRQVGGATGELVEEDLVIRDDVTEMLPQVRRHAPLVERLLGSNGGRVVRHCATLQRTPRPQHEHGGAKRRQHRFCERTAERPGLVAEITDMNPCRASEDHHRGDGEQHDLTDHAEPLRGVQAPARRYSHVACGRSWHHGSVPEQPIPKDADLPAFEILLGGGGRGLCEAVLEPAGGRVTSVRTTQVRYVPGTYAVVQYSTGVRWEGGRSTRETLIASTGRDVPAGTIVLSADGIEVAVWRFPHDPYLPGLPSAVDPDRVGELLTSLGADPGRTNLRTRAYRPGRRAVIEVAGHGGRIYLKVVRPERVEGLQERHVTLAAHVPVPHSLGWSGSQGIVALQALPGRPIRKSLEARARRLPDGTALVHLLDMFPSVAPDAAEVKGPVAHAERHALLLAAVLPRAAGRIESILGSLRTASIEEVVSVHGDFHSGQVLTDGGAITGLVDVDTAGVGERADDLATMLGHLSTLGLVSPARGIIDRYGAQLISAFDRVTDPADLRIRVAAVVLGLATGPFRVQESRWDVRTEARIGLAERWVAAAGGIT